VIALVAGLYFLYRKHNGSKQLPERVQLVPQREYYKSTTELDAANVTHELGSHHQSVGIDGSSGQNNERVELPVYG
jgi:hypothetical protein